MTDQFINQVFKTSVAALSQKLGWDASQTSAIDILADIWKRQLLHIGKTCHRYAEHYGRSEVNDGDVLLAFKDLNLSIPELEEYVQNFDPVKLPFRTPKFPVSKQSHLNFLRPGSKEVLTRPVHIHEYMPPWEIPDETAEKNVKEKDLISTDKEERKNSISHPFQSLAIPSTTSESPKPVQEVCVKLEDQEPLNVLERSELNEHEQDHAKESEAGDSQPQVSTDAVFRSFASSTKRGSSAGENPALKRVRILMAEEGHPLREISSVMMTTSGFLSSSREGRLPESRPPPNRDFFDPEPVVEKKKKSVTMKKIVEGVKKIEKENQDEVELFGKPDRLVIPELKHKSETPKKSKESSKSREETAHPVKLKHAEKESKSDKLKIFKKKSRDDEKLAKQREKDTEKPEIKLEVKMEQDLEEISSEEGTFQEHLNVKSFSPAEPAEKRRKKKSEDLRRSRKDKKRDRERLVPGVIPIPRISPKIPNDFTKTDPVKEWVSVKQKNRAVAFPSFSFSDTANKSGRSKKLRHLKDMKSLIPEISINVSKALPPLPELKPFFGTMSMAPGLIPTNLGPPPPLRFGGSSLSPSITITPAQPTPSGSKESVRKGATSLPIPSTVCASVTITRIDMPNSQSQQSSQFDSPITITPTVGGQHSSERQSPISVHHPDSTSGSGITITPILMTGDHSSKSDKIEKTGGSAVSLALNEDLSKEQRRKDKEKRKEIKKEKKKEKREKLREKERLRAKEEKAPLPEKKERKESRDLEPMVPKLTLKIHSNASTPMDSPNRVSERTETTPPPPPPTRKITMTIKPMEDLVTARTPSPELARFSPLVTRPPKVHKAALPKPSPPVVINSEKVESKSKSERRSSGKSKSKSKASSQSQSGLVTETVGFYIDTHGNKVWVCPAVGCGREDDGSPMIGCDICDDWYHFACVGIEETPHDDEHWYCPRCVKKGARKGR